LPIGVDDLLHSQSGEQGMTHFYAVLGFIFFSLFGFAASAAGVLVGLYLRLRSAKAENIRG
jgi:hypothetical protein